MTRKPPRPAHRWVSVPRRKPARRFLAVEAVALAVYTTIEAVLSLIRRRRR
jgi:hypothetical protein